MTSLNKLITQTFEMLAIPTVLWAMVCSVTFRYMTISEGPWNLGNMFYNPLRFSTETSPNVDYITGYPGLYSYFMSHIYSVLESSYHVYSITKIAASASLTIILYKLAIIFNVKKYHSILIACTVATIHYVYNTTFSPGTIQTILSLLGLLLLLNANNSTRSSSYIFIAFFVLTVATFTKQTGILYLAFGAAIFFIQRIKIQNLRNYLLRNPMVLILSPFLVYGAILAGSNAPNKILLVPLFLILFRLVIKKSPPFPTNNNAKRSNVDFIFATSGLTLSFFFCIWILNIESFIEWLKYSFIYIPKLINRHTDTIVFDYSTFFTIIGLGICLIINEALSKNIAIRNTFLAIFATFIIYVLNPETLLQKSYSISIIMLLTALSIYWWTKAGISSLLTILFCSILLTFGAFWPSIEYNMPVLLFVALVAFAKYHVKLNDGKLLFLLIIFSLNFNLAHQAVLQSSDLRPLDTDMKLLKDTRTKDDRIFSYVEAAEMILENVSDSDEVWTYPNGVLSALIANKVPNGKYGNFFGNAESDVKDYISELKKRRVKWLVVTKDFWHHGETHPYFSSYAEFLIELEPLYSVHDSSPHFTLYRLSN